jgi:hypothetical protein
MEKYQQEILEANKLFRTADHMVYVTFPLIKDNKLIITTVENLTAALIKAVNSIIDYDTLYRRISPQSDTFELRFETFKTKCASRYGIDRKHIVLIQDLKSIVDERKKSPMEFIRKDQYVICSDRYRIKALTMEKTKEYLNELKPFMLKINNVVRSNDTRF